MKFSDSRWVNLVELILTKDPTSADEATLKPYLTYWQDIAGKWLFPPFFSLFSWLSVLHTIIFFNLYGQNLNKNNDGFTFSFIFF